MIADKERVVRRDDAFIVNRERRFELRRTAGLPDHQALLRIFHQRSLAIIEWQGDSFGKGAN
jgi:hypothetical protein